MVASVSSQKAGRMRAHHFPSSNGCVLFVCWQSAVSSDQFPFWLGREIFSSFFRIFFSRTSIRVCVCLHRTVCVLFWRFRNQNYIQQLSNQFAYVSCECVVRLPGRPLRTEAHRVVNLFVGFLSWTAVWTKPASRNLFVASLIHLFKKGFKFIQIILLLKSDTPLRISSPSDCRIFLVDRLSKSNCRHRSTARRTA